jgi:hypothetical protein
MRNRQESGHRSHRCVYLEDLIKLRLERFRGSEREEHPDLPTDTVPPDSPPLILRTLGADKLPSTIPSSVLQYSSTL